MEYSYCILQLTILFGWFVWHRCSVGQLYAFFLQWSPQLYDKKVDIPKPNEGFVVVDDEKLEIVDDHFKPRFSQNWRVRKFIKIVYHNTPC